MATGTIIFSPMNAVQSDGSASNATPNIARVQGTEANPKKHYLTANFDAATDEMLTFQFEMPQDYSSGSTVSLLWTANATTGTCRWAAKIGAVTASDVDTPVEHALATAVTGGTATNATEARRLNSTTLDLTGNLDSAAAGDLCFLMVYRDADGTSGTDDLAVDAELITVALRYTTV